MATRFILLLVLAGAVVNLPALAESSNCATPVIIVVDGRVTQSTFPANTTFWYGIYAQNGHSYSVEFVPAADNYLNAARVQFNAISVYAPTDSLPGCRGNSSASATQTSGYSPVLKNGNGTGQRASFTAQTAGLYLISISNVAGNGTYSFRAVDTTLVNPRWSTYSGYDNYWGFMNVSDMMIAGTLTVYDVNGNVVASVTINLPPGVEKFRASVTNDLNVPRNNAGYATFTHNGPPNSVLADAYMANMSANMVFVSTFNVRGPQ